MVNLTDGFSASNDLHAYINCLPSCIKDFVGPQQRLSANNSKGVNSSAIATEATMIDTKLGLNTKAGVFPNPTTGDLYINLSAQNAGNMLVRITDVNGRVLINNTYRANAGGTNSYTLDLSSLENGVYAIAISDDAGNILKRDKVILAK